MMKNIFTFWFLIIIGYSGASQEAGIRFQEGLFEEIKNLAAQQDKPIFMDIYTTWCGPCKKMDKEVFSVDDVGGYFNQHFINFKVDAERGEGIEIARNYQVAAYPTMLFLDAKGNIKHSMRGYRPYEPFLDEAKAVIDSTHRPELADRYMTDRAFRKMLDEKRKQKLKFIQTLKKDEKLDSLHRSYLNGNRSLDFLAEYILYRDVLKVQDEKLIDEYFQLTNGQQLQGTEHLVIQSMQLQFAYDPEYDEISQMAVQTIEIDSPSFYLVQISNQLERAFMASWESAMVNKDTSALNSLIAKKLGYLQLRPLNIKEIEQVIIESKLEFYKSTGMVKQYHTLAQSEIIANIDLRQQADSSDIQDHAHKIATHLLGYEFLTLPKLVWKELLMQASENLNAFKHPNTYAAVLLMYHRLDQNNDAMNILREGMIMGKKQNLDTSTLFKLFTRIKKEKDVRS